MSVDKKAAALGAVDKEPIAAPAQPTVAELHARGERVVDEQALADQGMTLEQFLEAFGDYTRKELMKALSVSSLDSGLDKVRTNTNLVEGLDTVVGKPGSIKNVGDALARTEQRRRFLGKILATGGLDDEVPVARPARPHEHDTPVQQIQKAAPEAPAAVEQPPTAVLPPVAAPQPQASASPQTVITNDVHSHYAWLKSGGQTEGRMPTRSFAIEKELTAMLDLMAIELRTSIGFQIAPSQLLRKYLREGLIAEYERLHGSDK